ncbi:hypothetical protein C7C56_025385 [Massilia glaciei]|uniref:Uncharacterized protein n=1 Tax=Massilia glaciei TaxID=1524097 RepID=A0A2U2HDI0_9BURK|nr:hypothetical protein C7C56_025385 [Massilia glaciei]
MKADSSRLAGPTIRSFPVEIEPEGSGAPLAGPLWHSYSFQVAFTRVLSIFNSSIFPLSNEGQDPTNRDKTRQGTSMNPRHTFGVGNASLEALSIFLRQTGTQLSL